MGLNLLCRPPVILLDVHVVVKKPNVKKGLTNSKQITA